MRGGESNIDPRQFRNALGQFATGVTIVTTLDAAKNPVGVTVSSFNSVSLDPPLVLWSLNKTSRSLEAFNQSEYFSVHVLAFDQQSLSNQFARRGVEKFAGVTVERGVGNVPIIPDCAAYFQCATAHRHDGGDHIIFVGEVVDYHNSGKTPLIFHGGSYARARHVSSDEFREKQPVNLKTGSFGSNFFTYLLARAHFQLYRPLLSDVDSVGFSETDYLVLSALCIRDGLTFAELSAFLDHTGQSPTKEHVANMVERGLTSVGNNDAQSISITKKGRNGYLRILGADKVLEERALKGFERDEVVEFTSYLRRIIANTDPGVPDLWEGVTSSDAETDGKSTRS